MKYEALERMNLPFLDEVREEIRDDDGKVVEITIASSGRRKEPGDTITDKELAEAKQDDDAIAYLLESGAMRKA